MLASPIGRQGGRNPGGKGGPMRGLSRFSGRRRWRLLAVGAAVVAVGGGVATVGQGASTKTDTPVVTKASQIVPAPHFTAEDLAQLPTTDWITNGGTTTNQRYSPLNTINTSNVQNLKGVWRTHLRGRALEAKYSGESQPIVYKGTIFITSGDDDVFA